MLGKIHHLAIICSNYARSKRFYAEILGLKIIQEVYRKERDSYKLDLEVSGKYQLELFSFPHPPKRLSNPEGCGLRHLAFEVKDFEGTLGLLTKKGVQIEPVRVDQTTKKRFTFIKDPDDLPIELYEK